MSRSAAARGSAGLRQAVPHRGAADICFQQQGIEGDEKVRSSAAKS